MPGAARRSADTNACEPVAADFLPLPASAGASAPGRPALSYWQDTGARLRRNPRAMASLGVLGLLVAGTLLGPWLWPVDPALQRLDEVSQPPGSGRTALLVEDHRTWSGAASCAAAGTLAVCEPPHTDRVRLAWPAVAGAGGYAIYRHELAPGGPDDLGLPLGEVPGGDAPAFEDRLALEPRPYFYSVVALREGLEQKAFPALRVQVRQAITRAEAAARGLLPAQAPIVAGSVLELAPHPLGTDHLGRDLLARIIHGARTSLFIGVVAPLVFVLLGLAYGGLSGYLGGRADHAMMRVADFVIALPFLLFMILFKVAFGIGPGESGVMPMLVAMILLGWPATARLVRGQVLTIRDEPYVQAARLMGAGTPYLIRRHMAPNVMGVVLVTLSFAIPGAIFTEAFLSFIGLGVVPPTPSWGSMCNDGMRSMMSHPHELAVPAAFISLTVLAFNLLGDGLRDALDARMRSR